MRRRPTTRLLLTSWLVATAAGTLLVVSLTVLWAEAEALDRQLANRATLLSRTLGAAVAAGGTADLLATTASGELRAGVVSDARGEVLWRYGPSDVELRSMAPDLVWAEETVAAPEDAAGIHPGPFVSRVAVSRAEIRRTLVNTGLRVLAVLILVLVAAVIAGLSLADAVVQPVQRLADQLREFRVGRGQAAALPAGPTAELQEIAEAFDDMAQRLTAQQRTLEEGERRYRELFQASPAPQLELDGEGLIRSANEAAEPFLGAPPDELRGRSLEDFLTAASIPRFREAVRRVAEGHGVSVEAVWRLPSGDESEVGLVLGQAPAASGNGGTVVVLSDLADQVRRLGERWRRTFQVMHDGVAVIAADGALIQANDVFMDHRAEVEPGILERIGGRDELSWGVGSGDRQLACALFRKTPTGEAVVVVRDVTDAEEAQRRLREADRLQAMTRVAAGVAHDFNNLLAGIAVQLDLARRSPEAGPGVMAAVESLAAEGQQVVGEMLFLTGGVEPLVPLELGALLRECRDLLGHLCEGVAEFTLMPPQDPIWVSGNGVALRRALTNLVVNARDAIGRDRGGRIRVGCVPGGGMAVIRIEDDGPGIAPHAMDRLFEPFFTSHREGRGAGLGLAVVHSVVTDHGGSIEVTSEPGQGARFEVRLPTIEPPQGAPLEHRGPAVVVLDADGGRAATLLEVLASAGCDVSHVRTAAELERRATAPDALIIRGIAYREAASSVARLAVPNILFVDDGETRELPPGWTAVAPESVPEGILDLVGAMEVR